MSLVRKSLPLLLSVAASLSTLAGLDKDKKFSPPDLGSVTAKVTNDGITLAATTYQGEEQAKTAFGKVNPYEHGVLPVLVQIRNSSKATIKLDGMEVEYIDRNRDRIENTPAAEVPFVTAPKRPNLNPSPIPGVRFGKKNPLAAEEIQVRAWAAKMLPPGESAYGFFYFRTGHLPGAKLYVTGLVDAASSKELLYFEVLLD